MARSAFRRILSQRGVKLIEGDAVVEVQEGGRLTLASRRDVPLQDEVWMRTKMWKQMLEV